MNIPSYAMIGRASKYGSSTGHRHRPSPPPYGPPRPQGGEGAQKLARTSPKHSPSPTVGRGGRGVRANPAPAPPNAPLHRSGEGVGGEVLALEPQPLAQIFELALGLGHRLFNRAIGGQDFSHLVDDDLTKL